VYLAEDLKHNRRVAIKVMKTALSIAIGPDRFLREIEVAARLNHPHIVPLFDSGASGEALFYVMPYIHGESLRTRLARGGQLPLDEAVRFAKEIASALGHAHHHGLIHRDIKPENVLIADGIALVADFGIAFSTGTADVDQTQVAMTLPGGVVGTPIYMSPEQACGERVGPESDIYSLGCVLFEMLTSRPPFEGTSTESVVRMHLTEPAPAIDVLRPSIPPAVARVVARALAKRPQDRYGSAAQFAEALAAAAVGSTTPVPATDAEALPPNNLLAWQGRSQDAASAWREALEVWRHVGDEGEVFDGARRRGVGRFRRRRGRARLPDVPGVHAAAA
jgi:eukaryotic-like serine/threonine-protein kinase